MNKTKQIIELLNRIGDVSDMKETSVIIPSITDKVPHITLKDVRAAKKELDNMSSVFLGNGNIRWN